MAPTADSVGLTTKKTMSELRVIDLRSELEKRGLDKTGVKAALIERLTHALRDEGEDAETFEFEVPAEPTPVKPAATPPAASGGSAKKTVTKRVNKKLAHDAESETQSNDDAHEGGESDEEEEPEIETLDEEEEEDAEGAEEKLNNGEADPKVDGEEAGGDAKVEKKNSAKDSAAAKDDEDGSHEAEQALIVHADDNHDLDADIEEEAAAAKESAGAETPKPAAGAKTPAAKKAAAAAAAAAEAKKEAAEGGKAEPKKAATPKTKAAGKAVKTTPKAAADKEPVRNLWVSGLANTTRAADLKALFGKHGKVVSAKIVTNAKTPGARCYGFMTMSTAEEANKCIQHLHRTELHGKMISVECTKHEPGGALRKSEAKTGAAAAAATKTAAAAKEGKEPAAKAKPAAAKAAAKTKAAAEKKAAADAKEKEDKGEKAEEEEAAEEAAEEKEGDEEEEGDGDEEGKGKDRKHRDDKERRRSRSHSRERFARRRFFRPFVRGFRAVRGFRRPFVRRPFFRGPFRGRMGSDYRESREPFRRNEDAGSFRQRELERRQREEAFRIERERERLRVEREKLERERLELLRLEREKQRMERERIQREREELRQRKIGRAAEFAGPDAAGMMRRPVKRPYDDEAGVLGGPGARGGGLDAGDAFWRDRKRPHLGGPGGRDYDRGTDRDDRRFERPGGAGDFGGDREFRGRPPRDRVPRESPPVRRMEPRFQSKEGFSAGAGGAYGSGGARFAGGPPAAGGDHWSSGGRGAGSYSSSGVGGSWNADGRKPDSGHQSWSSQADRWSAGGSGMGARGGVGGGSMGQGSQGYQSGTGGSGMMAHSVPYSLVVLKHDDLVNANMTRIWDSDDSTCFSMPSELNETLASVRLFLDPPIDVGLVRVVSKPHNVWIYGGELSAKVRGIDIHSVTELCEVSVFNISDKIDKMAKRQGRRSLPLTPDDEEDDGVPTFNTSDTAALFHSRISSQPEWTRPQRNGHHRASNPDIISDLEFANHLLEVSHEYATLEPLDDRVSGVKHQDI
ncbi:hypothetical protein HPB50_024591 [Hyalomma asiaticum]|uniref:Uncharacterized protein n=1 Tax=Hyalomma asiaticum TaxID=266040 RepID=A0ACB7RL23_HYAAI|nr:hypothetical protein HPB50_024591 [Hyalomma asiaticum]